MEVIVHAEMILQRILILLGVALSCNGLRWDENYDLGENMTLIDVFMKSMELSDYRVPNIGEMEKGLKVNEKWQQKC